MIQGIIIAISVFTKDIRFFTIATQVLGFGSIGIAMILSGLMSENIYRRTGVENSTDREKRISNTEKFLLFGLPSIISLVVYFVLLR